MVAKLLALLALSCWLTVACAIPGGTGAETELSQVTPDGGSALGVAPSEASLVRGVERSPPASGEASERGLGPEELAIWNDPAFRARFAESYLSETEVEPRVTAAERERMVEVLEQIAVDRMDEAAALLRKHGGKTASAVFDFTSANIHFQREDFEPAAAAYRAAVLKFPKFRRAWRNLGLVEVRLSDFAAAAEAFTRTIELGGGDGVTWGLLGFAHASLGHHLSAESAYRMATLLDPRSMDWKTGLARSFFEQARFADAAALCGQLIEEYPERADLWLLQANAYIGLGEPLKAAENYELVERLGRSTDASLANLGDIYVNQELFDLGVDAYVQALERSPTTGVDRALRAAKVLTAHGALAEVRELLEGVETHRGERLEPEARKDLLQLRARVALADGAGDEEARLLEEIVALDPLDGEALILLGQHASRSGDPERAAFWFERAAALEAFEADAKIRHAQLLVGQGRYVEALPLLRRAQTLNPRDNVQDYLEQVERVAKAR